MSLWRFCDRRRWTIALLTVLALWPAFGSAAGPDNVLFVGWGQKVDNLDPQTSRGNRNWWVLAELYDTLTVLPDQSLQAAPQLAESWTISPDGKEYVFKIRKGVKFSTGNELNAHAVKLALDRLQTIGLGPAVHDPGRLQPDRGHRRLHREDGAELSRTRSGWRSSPSRP